MNRHLAWILAALILAGVSAARGQDENAGQEKFAGDYIIGVEDQLRIAVWKEQDLTTIATVRPDGKITVPLVNDIKVAGKTPPQVRAEITERMGLFVNNPHVTVIVEQINSFKVYMLGNGISRQGPLNFQQPTRLLQAIAVAGGFSDFSKKEITILRDMGGIEKRIHVKFKQFLAGDEPESNLFLVPGDTLIVD